MEKFLAILMELSFLQKDNPDIKVDLTVRLSEKKMEEFYKAMRDRGFTSEEPDHVEKLSRIHVEHDKNLD